MIASVLIIAFSVILLLYWFRYSCLLLLRHNAAAPDLLDNRFGFAHVQQELQGATNLDALHRTLERDYRLVMYLVEHAAGLNLPSIEDRLLVIDYKIMRV